MPVLRCLLYWCCLTIGSALYAQDPYHTVLNKADGLPSNTVFDLFQDSRGFVWIAGEAGLTRYDGYEFKTYSNELQTSRAGNKIQEDKLGRIWYRNFDGYLYYIENDSMKSFNADGLVRTFGYGIADTSLFVLTQDEVVIYNLAFRQQHKQAFKSMFMVGYTSHLNNFYVNALDTLYEITAHGSVQKKRIASSGNMLAGRNGLLIYPGAKSDKNAFYILPHNGEAFEVNAKSLGYIHSIGHSNDSGDVFWLFGPEGAWGYHQNGQPVSAGQQLFRSRGVSCVMRDHDGNYWFGTLGEGILFVPDLNTRLLATPNDIPSLLYRSRGKVYVGTKHSNLLEYNVPLKSLEKKFSYNVPDEIRSIAEDTVNHQFIIASNKLMVTDDKFKVKQILPNAVKDIVIADSKYAIYASSGQTSLMLLTQNGTSPWDSIYLHARLDGQSSLVGIMRARSIVYDYATSTAYCGSNKGLFKINFRGATEILRNAEHIYARKLAFYHGLLYILTPTGEVLRMTGNSIIQKVIPGSASEEVLQMKLSGGKLYLVTSIGIRVSDSVGATFRLLGFRNCIRTEEINDIEEIPGQLLIAADGGVVVIDPDKNFTPAASPGFLINRVLVNGRQKAERELTQLDYKEHDIDINYSILAYGMGNWYSLEFRVNDGPWQSTAANTRNLKLASLAPGRYDVQFRMHGGDGKLFEQRSLSFSIRKPFWTEWWFWTACFGAAAAGGYSYYKWQTSILKKKNALAVEKMELEKNLRASMLTSIRAQMNPHFFYNALNTIQSFIFSDEKRNASTYLVKLSKLTRTILEMSDKESVTLDEEIEALKLYLELERMRFNDEFTYEIRTDTEVDAEVTKIPSMILQPYVENAIKHGLLHKKGNKILTIDFRKQTGKLSITIEDNGVGREKAGAINQSKKEKPQSFSTSANARRIELLNKERSATIGVVYVDRLSSGGEPAGTTVIISVPLI